MGQNQNNTGKFASIFGKRRVAQTQPVSMIMDSNAPAVPVKKKVPIIPIIIVVVVIAIIFGVVMMVINSMKAAKSEALVNAYANCVSIFYDNGKTQDLRAKAQEDQALAKKVNNTNGWYITKISNTPKNYKYYDIKTYGEQVLSCLDNLEKAYNDSWQQSAAIKDRIDAFSKTAHIYADYMKINLTDDNYFDFYVANNNEEILNSYKTIANEASDSTTKRLYTILVHRYEAEKKYASFVEKNKCYDNTIINRDCMSQFNESQAVGNISARKIVAVGSMQTEFKEITGSLISLLGMIGDLVW